MLPELKENLIKAGKEEGCISFDDLNELLPDEIKDPNEIESILCYSYGFSLGIRIHISFSCNFYSISVCQFFNNCWFWIKSGGDL